VDVLPIVRVGANSTDKITVEELGTLFGGGLEGSQYIYVAANGTDIENAAELQAAYTAAQMRLPTSTKRITIIAGPGNYNFESNVFTMDTDFIDLVSLDGNRSIIFNAPFSPSTRDQGSISIFANDVFVKGVDVESKEFRVSDNLLSLNVENCVGGDFSFGGGGGICSGTFTDCVGGDFSFGTNGTASGTFTDCQGGVASFSGNAGTASGIFANCVGGLTSFSGSGGIASGTFANCVGGGASFSGGFGNATGIFTNCVGDNGAFGSFGGILSGRLYYCRLTTGVFQIVSGAGKTVYCVDGNGEPNNQGFTPQNNL
jgi:hypothetical protein